VADVFISYAHHDSDVVKELSPALESAGYSTWYYEDKGAIGASYLLQIDQEIERCSAVIVVISPDSVASDQVSKEVVRAHEARKKFIPVRRDITHEEFQRAQPEWRMAFGAAVSAEVPPDGAASLAPRIVDGLRRLGVEPGRPERSPASPFKRLSRAAVSGVPARDSKLAAAIAMIVGGLGTPYCLYYLAGNISPAAGSPGAALLQAFPSFRTWGILVNLAGIALNAVLFYGGWLVRKRDPRAGPLVRKVAIAMMASIVIWLVASLSIFSGAQAKAMPEAARSYVIRAIWMLAAMGLIPAGIVFALFRNARGERRRA
jgi:hypothetical protein